MKGLDDLDKAKNLYEKLLKLDPEYLGTYYHLAKLFEALESPTEALNIYQLGIEMTSKKNDLHALAELKNAKMNFELEN